MLYLSYVVYLKIDPRFEPSQVLVVLDTKVLFYTFKPVPKPLEVEPTCILGGLSQASFNPDQ